MNYKARRSWLIALALFSFAPLPARSFVPVWIGNFPERWNVNTNSAHTNVVNPFTKKVRYFIASDTYSAANRTNEVMAIRSCFDQWQSVPGAKLQFEAAGFAPPQSDSFFDNQNVVFWVKTNLVLQGGFLNMSGIRAYTSVTFSYDNGSIVDADIILNGKQFEWFTDWNNTTNQAQFIESILLHEIGHFVGLDHTPAGGATVIDGPNGIGTTAGLSADEVAAMRYLYPDPAFKWSAIKGRVTRQGQAVPGAMVIVEDSAGNIAGATVTRFNGDYEVPSLPLGDYNLRVTPFDPSGTPKSASLMTPEEIGPDNTLAETSFLPTTNFPISIPTLSVKTQNVSVLPGNPPFRITSISSPSIFGNLVSVSRAAISLKPGQSNMYVGVSSTSLVAGSTLKVTGDGITMGPTTFYPRHSGSLNGLTAMVQVSSNATPGLRSLVVQNGANLAYANGYLEIAPLVPDFNFDGLDDRFQRKYWKQWTRDARPEADADGDVFSNLYEFQLGTNPTNKNSYPLAIDSVKRQTRGTVLTWLAEVGKKYQVWGRLAFQPNAPWEKLGIPTQAGFPVSTYVDTTSPGATKFYRVEIVP